MNNAVKILVIIVAIVFVLSSCQDVFTKSVFSFVETDISSMSDAQKISYAEDLLATGDEEALEEAYAAISEMIDDDIDLSATDLSAEDLELLSLGADLAIGASGVGDAVTDALGAFASTDESTDIEGTMDTILGGFDDEDYSNLEDAVTYIEAIENNGVVPTDEQYANAAAAQLLIVINEAGGTDNLLSVDPEDPDLAQAVEWAEAGGVDLSSMFGGLSIPE